jgi:hypothetical protein
MPTIDAVRKTKDPAKRAQGAAKIGRQAQDRADAARLERDRAAVSLYKHYGWEPVEVYRALDVSRSLFVRICERVGPVQKVPNAEQVMNRAARTVARNEALVEEARVVRDEAATGMLHGKYRKPGGETFRNAEVAKCTKLSTARIAQLRHGRR